MIKVKDWSVKKSFWSKKPWLLSIDGNIHSCHPTAAAAYELIESLIEKENKSKDPLAKIPACEEILARYNDLTKAQEVWEDRISHSVQGINYHVNKFLEGGEDIRSMIHICDSEAEQEYAAKRFEDAGYTVKKKSKYTTLVERHPILICWEKGDHHASTQMERP